MKKKGSSILSIILLFIIGLAILLYPSFSNWWNERRAQSLITEYDEVIQTIDTSTIDEIREKAHLYNKSLIGTLLPDAFAEEEANSPNPLYETILNPAGTGYMGTIEIPVINVTLPIYHYTTEEVLQTNTGHLAGSSVPVGGESTHSVLSAHRGLPSAKLFTDLDRVYEGDIFYIHVLGDTLAYVVDQINVVEPTETDGLSIEIGEDLVTLITCTPYAVNSHRLLVRGHRVPYTPEQYAQESNKITIDRIDKWLIVFRVLSVVAGIGIAFIIMFIRNKRANKKNIENKKLEDRSQYEQDS